MLKPKILKLLPDFGKRSKSLKRCFDTDYYTHAYPDVGEAKIDPLQHYLTAGWREGRNPNLNFNTIWYLHAYQDVARQNQNPLVDYVNGGQASGRLSSPPVDESSWMTKAAENEFLPASAREFIACYDMIKKSALFDETFYTTCYPDAQGDPLEHFIRNGWRLGYHPSPNFDMRKYLQSYEDVRASGQNPLIHYLKSGRREGRRIEPLPESETWKLHAGTRAHQGAALYATLFEKQISATLLDESGLFDAEWYLNRYPDVRSAGMDPRGHFISSGSAEFRSPGPGFDAEWYCRRYEDVLDEGYEPLVHYVKFGRAEGRDATPPTPDYTYTYALSDPGPIPDVVPARRPINDHDFALEVPFHYAPDINMDKPVAAIVHAFYPDLLEHILGYLENIPCAVDLYISTDSAEKVEIIGKVVRNWSKGSTDVRIMENRGRDIAPMIVGFRDVFAKHDIFLHVHTKRSPHAGDLLYHWRDYLLNTLFGTGDIARSVLSLFNDPKIGVVFPQHFFEVRRMLNWGFDYDLARNLLARVGVQLNKDLVLEFPSGSMFWGRTDAIHPLLDLDLQCSDFPEEAGQIDGTLAHAIERTLLMVAESKGYEWLKVARRDLYPLPDTVLKVTEPADLLRHRLRVFQPCLARADAAQCYERFGMPETRSILSYPSRNNRPRINLLIPSINPGDAYGGLSTAIRIFEEISSNLAGAFDRRIIVTDSHISSEALSRFSDYAQTMYFQSEDDGVAEIVGAGTRRNGRLNLRANDIFVATAWWTACHAIDLLRDQKLFFKKKLPFIYLLQDDEPYFYGWSTKWALAESTYRHGPDTIAIINSEELYLEIIGKYDFLHSFCYPYAINGTISKCLAPEPRERLILVYARPHALRNAFELICEALKQWQQHDPVSARAWEIICLGEEFDKALTEPVQNMSVKGKVSLETYADYLNRGLVGISLMLSPHPSYPPLEMAEAGLVTITNRYGTKDLSQRFDDIISLDRVDARTLAEAIKQAVAKAEGLVGKRTGRRKPKNLRLDAPIKYYASSKVAELLKELVGTSIHRTTGSRGTRRRFWL